LKRIRIIVQPDELKIANASALHADPKGVAGGDDVENGEDEKSGQQIDVADPVDMLTDLVRAFARAVVCT
jgi:hypothetical protein